MHGFGRPEHSQLPEQARRRRNRWPRSTRGSAVRLITSVAVWVDVIPERYQARTESMEDATAANIIREALRLMLHAGGEPGLRLVQESPAQEGRAPEMA